MLVRGMTLIELIGVLAVLAVLAAMLVPALIKGTDQVVANNETAALQSFNDALLRVIQRNRWVPGTNEWASALAAELGLNISDVSTNLRHQPRFFLIDPALSIDGKGLSYIQDSNASSNAPVSPRVIILSSLGRSFAAGMGSCVPGSSDFSNLWNTADGQLPAASLLTTYWSGGQANDLKIQRVNLAQAFVNLVLSYSGSTSNAYYAIDNNPVNPVTNSAGLSTYIIKNSILNLYSGQTNNLVSRQILGAPAALVYSQNNWCSTLAASGGAAATNSPGEASIFSSIANGFLASSTATTSAPPMNVLTNFINYMSAYTNWAGSGFSNNTYYNAASAAYTNLANSVNSLTRALP